jgi:hypothetical protein
MGLFNSATTVTFGSVVYNLAGPVAQRPQYLKTTMIGAVLNDVPSISDAIHNSYMAGPGITLRTFTNWANTSGFTTSTGQSGSSVLLAQTLDQTVLAALIPAPPGDTVAIQTSSIGRADCTQWADQYVALNYPASVGTAYTSSIDLTTNTVTVVFPDTTTVSFVASGYDPMAIYLYSAYNFVSASVTGPLVPGTPVTLGGGVTMPSTIGWTNDGGGVWERTDFQGWNSLGTAVTWLRQVMTQIPTPLPGSYEIDTQLITGQAASAINVLIYKQGSGNPAMDALFVPTTSGGDFFPYIPIRLFQTFISPTFLPDVYAGAKKALKKSIRGDLDKLIADISTNPSLSDIDNAYVVFGVPLNTKDNSSLEYIYKFFQEINAGQDLSGGAYAAFQIAWNTANATALAWKTWSDAQGNPLDPLYGTVEPNQTPYPVPSQSYVTVNSAGRAGINYASTVLWYDINEITGTGLIDITAVPGTLWFEQFVGSPTIPTLQTTSGSFNGVGFGGMVPVRLNWQVDATHWRCLDLYGLTHDHLLSAGVVITTGAEDALNDTGESGFIVPMHSGVFKSMSLVTATQMSASCAYIVFTTAIVTRTPWYATTLFKIFIVVIVIIIAVVVTIFTGGAGTPGVLGTAGEVGGALGLTGTAALIAGAVVNAIAAMILTEIITSAATAAFGPKVGSIIGAVASFVVVSGMTSYMSGLSVSASFTGMTLITNLAKLTFAIGNGISQYMQAAAQDTMGKTQDLLTSYNQDALQIQQQTTALLGSDNGIIDPLAYSNADQTGGTGLMSVSDVSSTTSAVETADIFLSRTLMTGSDLAGLSLDMIGNFADLTLSSDLPI